jgi:hypothetical protein
MTPAASAEELRAILGDVDDLVVERIVTTGATIDEVGEAIDDLEDERGFGEGGHVPSSPRVTEVRRILAELLSTDEGGEEGEPAVIDEEGAEGYPV